MKSHISAFLVTIGYTAKSEGGSDARLKNTVVVNEPITLMNQLLCDAILLITMYNDIIVEFSF
jgi:hypothetical protein